ncbi:MAG: endonuclease NucS [Nostoc sp. DedQUE05]|uniref:endonuclease NucS domain-containing protein n=1 Tax=Nostoc sp. DedQUE05 TaxID=3075391 RepID=UPI002AD30D37|nr:endonuclease NucS domain-containing protein [Nostoc sp. DedQUE05]MDZ8092475.1 endonuclease NucS [Nostoc sp. DedQUE05]
MINEADIRDFLTDNLDIIEPDLKFIQKEFSLENSLGAGGRIDILAKDKFGSFVIIEIKKSDKNARQALHELLKYMALFKTNYGLAAKKCRCILLSTEWHELLIPFSEFHRFVNYQIDGYQLILNEEGIPISKKIVPLVPESEERFIFPIHNIFLYEINEERAIATEKLKGILTELEIKNYYILVINYEGDSKNVSPFALYLVINKFKNSEKQSIKKTLNIFDADDEFDEEIDIKLVLEYKALSEITNRLMDLIDTIEGTSETLQGMMSNGWNINKIYTGNQLSLNLLITDEEIIKEITSFEGGNSIIYTSVTTPKNQSSWKATSEGLKHFLYGNDLWQIGCDWFFNKVESVSREATVNLRIYYGSDILFSLYNYFCRGVSYLPTLEIVAQIAGQPNKTIILVGSLEWDRHTFPNAGSIFNKNNPLDLFSKQKLYFKEEPLYELLMMHKHGIEYSLFEITIEQNTQAVIKRLELEEDDIVTLLPITDEVGLSLRDFFIHNRGYIEELCYIGGSCFHFVS